MMDAIMGGDMDGCDCVVDGALGAEVRRASKLGLEPFDRS